jgi:hypothetical protein
MCAQHGILCRHMLVVTAAGGNWYRIAVAGCTKRARSTPRIKRAWRKQRLHIIWDDNG